MINNPEFLIEQARVIVTELEKNSITQSADRERIEKELDAIMSNRQWVIAKARKGGITEEEMDHELSEMSLQEAALKRELDTVSETIDSKTLENWERYLNQYLLDMQEGLQALEKTPETLNEEKEIFLLKRRVIETLVERVTVDRNRQFTVTIKVNLLQILENKSEQGGSQGSGGQWPNSSSKKSPQTTDRKSGFKSRACWIRVSSVWQA